MSKHKRKPLSKRLAAYIMGQWRALSADEVAAEEEEYYWFADPKNVANAAQAEEDAGLGDRDPDLGDRELADNWYLECTCDQCLDIAEWDRVTAAIREIERDAS